VARAIVERTADRLAELINHVHKTYDVGDVAVVSGGIAINEQALGEMIRERLDAGIELVITSTPPIFGAMRRCAELYAGGCDYDAFLSEFEESYKKFNV
jgi:predicted NBD/HSP70 family sugar kinase